MNEVGLVLPEAAFCSFSVCKIRPQGRQTSSCGNFLAALAIPVTGVSNGCEELNIEVESNVSFCVPILGTRKGT